MNPPPILWSPFLTGLSVMVFFMAPVFEANPTIASFWQLLGAFGAAVGLTIWFRANKEEGRG